MTRPDLNETMTMAEAQAWADDVIDRLDAQDWYGMEYSTCDPPENYHRDNPIFNAETVIRTQSGEDAACVGEDAVNGQRIPAGHVGDWMVGAARKTPGEYLSERYEDLMDKD